MNAVLRVVPRFKKVLSTDAWYCSPTEKHRDALIPTELESNKINNLAELVEGWHHNGYVRRVGVQVKVLCLVEGNRGNGSVHTIKAV